MTKAQLIESVAKNNSGLSKRAIEGVVDAAFEEMAKAIKKEKRFSFPGFGTFTVRKRKARKGRNPQTGESIKIAASKTVGFKPSPTLKKSL
ncbi:MAG: HU family DNA-binding protein [Chrysiogenetes bacterium]|nr:HU family DNA-binding protein [Chrysiogenetes bacterium]